MGPSFRGVPEEKSWVVTRPIAATRPAPLLLTRPHETAAASGHTKKGDTMLKKIVTMALAVSILGLSLLAPSAEARKGRGGHDDPKECEFKSGRLVCK